MRCTTFGRLTFALLLLTTAVASAQVPRYTPQAGRTLPNALNYFRRDTGVLDPYNAFVAPQRDLQQNLQNLSARQEEDRERQATLRQQDQQAFDRLRLQVRPSAAAATGAGSDSGGHTRFANYSHFYQMPMPQRTNRRR